MHRLVGMRISQVSSNLTRIWIGFVLGSMLSSEIKLVAHLAGIEPTTPAFGGQYSIQVSYRC